MRYQGGKHSSGPMIARHIALAGRGRRLYIEPFVGGGNVLVHVRHTFTRIAADVHPDLIAMWKAVQEGWEPPRTIDKDHYEMLKASPPGPERGFAGFAASFGGQWFTGYGKSTFSTTDATSRWLTSHRAQIANVEFKCADYRDFHPGADAVVYADPPYANTTAYAGTFPFDVATFWDTMNTWVGAGAVVLVSEYDAPPPWVAVRTRVRPNRLRMQHKGSAAIEHLFRSTVERGAASTVGPSPERSTP